MLPDRQAEIIEYARTAAIDRRVVNLYEGCITQRSVRPLSRINNPALVALVPRS